MGCARRRTPPTLAASVFLGLFGAVITALTVGGDVPSDAGGLALLAGVALVAAETLGLVGVGWRYLRRGHWLHGAVLVLWVVEAGAVTAFWILSLFVGWESATVRAVRVRPLLAGDSVWSCSAYSASS